MPDHMEGLRRRGWLLILGSTLGNPAAENSITAELEICATDKPRVLLGLEIHEDALARLREEAAVDIVSSKTFQDTEHLIEIIGAYDGILHNVPRLSREILSTAGRLRAYM